VGDNIKKVLKEVRRMWVGFIWLRIEYKITDI
jgi:hypothetical protein